MITVLTLLFVLVIKQNAEKFINNHSVLDTEEYSVMNWLDAFSNQDFDTCDLMVENSTDALYSGQVLGLIGESTYYDETLKNLVKCISSMQVESVESNGGTKEYSIKVTFTPYKAITELEIDSNSLNEEIDSYISGDDTQFGNKLSQVYLEIFENNCFVKDEEAVTQQKVLTLSEKEVNGVTRIEGTVSFVDSLLSDSNIRKNIETYETDVKEQISNIINAF
jgi:hypothetical protein